SIPLSGGSFTTLASGAPLVHPHGIALGGNTLYITDGNQILQMPATGGTPTLLVTDARFGTLNGLTYFNNALYVPANHANSAMVWKVDLGTPPVNHVPTVNAGPDATLNAGATFASTDSFTDPDPDTWTATVDYGDGSGAQPLALNADKTFSLQHVYATSG